MNSDRLSYDNSMIEVTDLKRVTDLYLIHPFLWYWCLRSHYIRLVPFSFHPFRGCSPSSADE